MNCKFYVSIYVCQFVRIYIHIYIYCKKYIRNYVCCQKYVNIKKNFAANRKTNLKENEYTYDLKS